MKAPGNLKPRRQEKTTPPIPKPLGGPYKAPTPTPKKKTGPGIPKASLGAIVKGVKSMFGMGAKVAKGTKKVAKTVKKAAKTYGDNGSYNRLSDMKKSEFYRDRHNAGKVYNAAGTNKGKAIATGAAVVGLGAAAIAKKKAEGKSTIKKK
jgi:hypothetical protein